MMDTFFCGAVPSDDYLADDEGSAMPQGLLPDTATPVLTGQGRVLFVDDEAMLVRLGQQMLASLGYDVVVSTSSAEALSIFRATPERFDVVITDQTMPHMTGEVLVHHLRSIRPEIPVILCTGFSHMIDEAKAQQLGINAFLMKPVTLRELCTTIQHVLALSHGAQPSGCSPPWTG